MRESPLKRHPDPDLPERIGPYRILRRLGRGGLSEVFLAVAQGASGFEKRVAIKTLRPELVGDSALERLLIEEAKLGALVSHRNLIQVHDLGVDRGGAYYVRMDYVDGADLARLLARRRPGPALARFIAGEVASALAHLHSLSDDAGRELGLIHRDVSPANILLSRSGEVKLVDLGIAKATLLTDRTWGRLLKGTFAYMSPEQARGEPPVRASDLYGLGVTLIELLGGKRPFEGETPLETITRIRAGTPVELGWAPASFRPVLARMLAPRPEKRFADAAALARCLARIPGAPAGPADVARYVTRDAAAGDGG